MILVIDNYDSFTFNLVQALQAAGAEVRVVRNDAIDRSGIEGLARDESANLNGIVISPGPSDPDHAGVSMDAVRVATERAIPLLGVCLGMQSMAQAYGGSIVRAPTLVHGEAAAVTHDGAGLWSGFSEDIGVATAAGADGGAVGGGVVPPFTHSTMYLIRASGHDAVWAQVVALRRRCKPRQTITLTRQMPDPDGTDANTDAVTTARRITDRPVWLAADALILDID